MEASDDAASRSIVSSPSNFLGKVAQWLPCLVAVVLLSMLLVAVVVLLLANQKVAFISFFLISISRTPEADSNNSSHHLPAILASTEAAKDFVHHVQQVNSKTPKESRHAKNVQASQISASPIDLEYRPGEHGKQSLSSIRPVTDDHFPAEHDWQSSADSPS